MRIELRSRQSSKALYSTLSTRIDCGQRIGQTANWKGEPTLAHQEALPDTLWAAFKRLLQRVNGKSRLSTHGTGLSLERSRDRPDLSFSTSSVLHPAENDLRTKRARRFEYEKQRHQSLVKATYGGQQPYASTPEPEANPVSRIKALSVRLTLKRHYRT
jgi:hypothetical protein